MLKKLISISLAALMVAIMLTGCNENANVTEGTAAQSTTRTTTTTTTTTTTQRTTENLETTFKEGYTNKVYDTLYKDESEYQYRIAGYETYYDSGNTTRTVNIQNAVSRLNNIKIPAGKVFSFNQIVGKRTITNGYQAAKVVVGDEFVDGLGGGICQVSSTIFQAALRSNLDIVVRACHSLEIGYVPLGGDATVQWNTQDFQFKNNTNTDIKLVVVAQNGALKCAIYSKEKVELGDVKVKIKKGKKDGTYTLTRTVDGVENYTTYSKYKKPVTTTKKQDSKDKKTTKKKSTTKKSS